MFGLALRLYHLNAPPVDYLSWRDTQTLMVARNFYREGMNLFSPSVDWRSTREMSDTGTVGGTELPVVPYLTAALYHVFGIHYWVGRIVPILFALLGTAYFFWLIERFYGVASAALGALLLTVSPYFLFCGRVQMPEAFAYAMAFGALYYYDRWLHAERHRFFARAVVFSALAVLGKPPLGIIVVPMAFLTLQQYGRRALRKPALYLFALLVGVPCVAYMAYSCWVLIPRSGLSFAQPGLLNYGRYLTDPDYYVKVASAVWSGALTPIVCVLAFVGLIAPRPRGTQFFAHAWAFGALSSFFLIPGGNIANGYYHMILAPPAIALGVRPVVSGLRHRVLRFPAVAAVCAAAVYSLYIAARLYAPYYASARDCGEWIRTHTPPETRVLTASPNPATLYFADRIGWTSWCDVFGPELINKVIPLGADILAVSDETFDNAYYPQYNGIRESLYDAHLCFHGKDFAIFSLHHPAGLSLPENGHVAFGTPESRKFLRGTWGPDQEGTMGRNFVALGPAPRAAITFTAAKPVKRILLEIASAVPDQTVSFEVCGNAGGTLPIPNAFEPGQAAIDCATVTPPDGRWTITLEASRQNANRVSMLLYTLDVSDGLP